MSSKKHRTIKKQELRDVSSTVILIYQKYAEVTKNSYPKVGRFHENLPKIWGEGVPSYLGALSRKQQILVAIAVIAGRYQVELPQIRKNTKHVLEAAVRSFGDEVVFAAIQKFPEIDESLFLSTTRRKTRKKEKERTPPKIKTDVASRFYASYDWRKLRYAVLAKYGRKCMLCGRTDGVFHVDHIKPLKKYWNLRLEFSNMQVLCDVCNHGKGNWDETDWRPEEPAALKVKRYRPTGPLE